MNIFIKLIASFIVFIYNISVVSQEINAPTLLEGTNICGSSIRNSFKISFSVTDPFNVGNDFTVFLSDENGNFENRVNVATIFPDESSSLNANIDFFGELEHSFTLPTDTAGEGYRIQVVSTDPVRTSEFSIPFAAYFQPEVGLSIVDQDGNEGLTICNNFSAELSVVLDDSSVNVDDYEYGWFLEQTLLDNERGSTLTITTPGRYEVRFYQGESCTLSSTFRSNTFIVESANVEQVFIEGENSIELCANETYEFTASVDNTSYIYSWYKGEELLNTPGYMPTFTTEETDQYGVYRLEVDSGADCTVFSQDVTIQPKEGSGFTLTIDSDLTRLILPTEAIVLSVVATPSSDSLSYNWFKDGDELFQTQSEIQIIGSGEYYVEVVDDSSECAVVIRSEVYTFLNPTTVTPTIRVDNYEACNSQTASINIVGVNAVASNGESYELSSDQVSLLMYQWIKDDEAVEGETGETINITSYTDNGEYTLNAAITTGGGANIIVEGFSESETILLSPVIEIVSSSLSNKLCTGSSINLSITPIEGYTYTWFKDDLALEVADTTNIEVEEIGDYYVTYEGFGCLNYAETIEIEAFDEDVLELMPSTTAVLVAEQTVVLSATGADTYEWYNEDSQLLSENETLEIGILGTYTLIGSVGECQIEKEIEVVADDGSFIIPNILTPFGSENVNDTWEIPNKFSFQEDVQIIIYNSGGKEVLNVSDYQNNWPEDIADIRAGMLFYFRVIQEDTLIKAGTISVLE